MKKLEINSGLHEYESHLKRLIKLKYNHTDPHQSNSVSHRQLSRINQGLQVSKEKRSKTNNLDNSKRTIPILNIKSPCRIPPLMSTPEKRLLSESLETKKMTPNEAELIL